MCEATKSQPTTVAGDKQTLSLVNSLVVRQCIPLGKSAPLLSDR